MAALPGGIDRDLARSLLIEAEINFMIGYAESRAERDKEES